MDSQIHETVNYIYNKLIHPVHNVSHDVLCLCDCTINILLYKIIDDIDR